jgi:hypothetical protein
VTAKDQSGNPDPSYTGTLHFSSSDTAADAGTHTFAVSLMTPPSQTITVTDIATASLSATSSPVTVNP